MGRPPSLTGTIMSGFVLECEVLLAQVKRTAHGALKKRTPDPIHYIGAIGEIAEQLEQLDMAVRNIRATVEANGAMPGMVEDPAELLHTIAQRMAQSDGPAARAGLGKQ